MAPRRRMPRAPPPLTLLRELEALEEAWFDQAKAFEVRPSTRPRAEALFAASRQAFLIRGELQKAAATIQDERAVEDAVLEAARSLEEARALAAK